MPLLRGSRTITYICASQNVRCVHRLREFHRLPPETHFRAAVAEEVPAHTAVQVAAEAQAASHRASRRRRDLRVRRTGLVHPSLCEGRLGRCCHPGASFDAPLRASRQKLTSHNLCAGHQARRVSRRRRSPLREVRASQPSQAHFPGDPALPFRGPSQSHALRCPRCRGGAARGRSCRFPAAARSCASAGGRDRSLGPSAAAGGPEVSCPSGPAGLLRSARPWRPAPRWPHRLLRVRRCASPLSCPLFLHSFTPPVLLSADFGFIGITWRILRCLRPRTWINDEVVNFYLGLMQRREVQLGRPVAPRVHFHSSFFGDKLYVNTGAYSFQAIKKWHRRWPYSLLSCERIIVPLHLTAHWVLVCVDLVDNKAFYLDSMPALGNSHMVRLRCSSPSHSSWRSHVHPPHDRTTSSTTSRTWLCFTRSRSSWAPGTGPR